MEQPQLSKVLEALRSLAGRETIVLAARCSASYIGRGEAYLAEGDRVLIIKQDSSMQLQQPVSPTPVMWQPSGSVFSFHIEGHQLVITVLRQKPSEVVTLRVSKVYMLYSMKLHDDAKLASTLPESAIYDAIMRDPSMIEPGMRVVKLQKKTSLGIADLLCEDSQGRLVVIEVKREASGEAPAIQLKRYVESIKASFPNREVRGLLVALRITEDSRRALAIRGLEARILKKEELLNLLLPKRQAKLIEIIK